MKLKAAQIKPMYEHILVEKFEAKAETTGGIIIPEAYREKVIRGVVIATGSGRRNADGSQEKPWAKPGDKVVYSRHAGSTVEIDLDNYMLLEDQDVFALVRESDGKESLEPVMDRLLVKPIEREISETIILTDDKFDDHKVGVVISKGPKVSVELGDQVLFNSHDGLEFNSNDEDLLMLREQDLYGVIEYEQ